MRKISAFAAAFLATLAVALIPLAARRPVAPAAGRARRGL